MLKIDHRETKIKALLPSNIEEEKGAPVFENLTFGDFQILDKEGNVVFLFERKTLDDLSSSIKDGRYKNQKARCSQVYHVSQMYYIIEGNFRFKSKTSSASDKMLIGAVLNTALRDKIAVFQTRNVEETWELIQCVWQRYMADPEKYNVKLTTGLDAEKKQTNEEVTVIESVSTSGPRTVYKCMLCQIPSVSDKTAVAIMDVYPSWNEFMSTMMPLAMEERKALLEKIKVNGRKISCRVVEQMLSTLF
jgi:ERCC4-type nuclease